LLYLNQIFIHQLREEPFIRVFTHQENNFEKACFPFGFILTFYEKEFSPFLLQKISSVCFAPEGKVFSTDEMRRVKTGRGTFRV